MGKITTLTATPILVVRFRDGRVFFFGSLSAIYEKFTPDEVGCPLYRLYGGALDQQEYDTGRCVIGKATLYRKRQTK